MPLNIIRTENPFQKAIPEPIQRMHPLESLPHSLIREAEPLSMTQNKQFFMGIRLFTIVKEAVDVKVWKRKITNQGPQRALTGAEFWGRLASVSWWFCVTRVRKTSWIWSRREWEQSGTYACLSSHLTLTVWVAYSRSLCSWPWSCAQAWPRTQWELERLQNGLLPHAKEVSEQISDNACAELWWHLETCTDLQVE